MGVTGISYGGGISNILAYLRDRVRMPNGALVPWTQPERQAAADQRGLEPLGLGRPDLLAAPNGRFLDTKKWKPATA